MLLYFFFIFIVLILGIIFLFSIFFVVVFIVLFVVLSVVLRVCVINFIFYRSRGDEKGMILGVGNFLLLFVRMIFFALGGVV